METDFLNFHDEEHFASGVYQNDFMDETQSFLLDIAGDRCSHYGSEDFIDDSLKWEQDVEHEINGDIAVIPMTGHMNSFASNSPPSKDIQKIFSDWQHFVSIETSPTEDLPSDLQLGNQTLMVDMFDCTTPTNTTSCISVTSPKITSASPNKANATTVPSFDFSSTSFPTVPIVKPKKQKIVRQTGGKNLELLKQVVKEEVSNNEFLSSDDLDSANDSFDITSYVIGDNVPRQKTSKKCIKSKPDKSKKRNVKRKNTKKIKVQKEIKIENIEKVVQEDSEEDCIDVETVSDQMPLLEATDLTSLLEQFEANEAVNSTLPSNLFNESASSQMNSDVKKIPSENNQSIPLTINTTIQGNKSLTADSKHVPKHLNSDIKPKFEKMKSHLIKSRKQVNSELKQPQKQFDDKKRLIKNTFNQEMLDKMKAYKVKKPVSVIPARESKKPRSKPVSKIKIARNESFKHDHDYCSVKPVNNKRNFVAENNINENVSLDNKIKDDINNKNIDDTAIRIEKQIKMAINNENIIKQKIIKTNEILKNQPTVKSSDGKLMVSLLKTNNRLNANIINKTLNQNEENIQNNHNNTNTDSNSKKRKLNLEEYKKLRGAIIKSNNNSSNNSLQNSPKSNENNNPATLAKIEYQELIMKMASDVLKINAKQKSVVCETKLDEFVPPEAQKQQKVMEKIENTTVEQITPKPIQENFKIKTLVSIGVNTINNENNKISFKIQNKTSLQRSKYFVSKSPVEETSSKTESNVTKINEIITPILKTANSKINSNSLIANITATLLQNSPINSPKPEILPGIIIDPAIINKNLSKNEVSENKKTTINTIASKNSLEHGEDKIVIILNENDKKPLTKTIGIQTEKVANDKPIRNYRLRKTYSSSSLNSVSSVENKCFSNGEKKSSLRLSVRKSPSFSLSSSEDIRSRSRSCSRSRSSSNSDFDSSSNYSRSRSRSFSSEDRWYSAKKSKSGKQFYRLHQSRSRSRSIEFHKNYVRSSYSRKKYRKKNKMPVDKELQQEVEERRVIYVGKISNGTTKADLRRRFERFGPITKVSVHFRNHGDNYGFVTFAYKVDAYEAVENGNYDPNLPHYDISFGGRRAFCKTRYSDLDNLQDDDINTVPMSREEDFDILLRELRAKLLKRKV